MKNKRFLVIFLVALVAFGLAACTRSASKTTEATPTPEEGEFPVPGTQSPMEVLEDITTQTAMAMEAGQDLEEAEPQEEEPSGPTATVQPEGPAEEPEVSDTPEPAAMPEPEEEEEYNFKTPETYKLKKGEFPYCIARRFDIDPDELLAENGLNRNSVVQPGLVLEIPEDPDPFDQGPRALKDHPTTYTVVAGDTIYTIACAFGDVDPRAIAAANDLEKPFTLTAGQTLQIP
jgi:LysM repeat protein